MKALLKRYKSQIGDSVWSILGLVLMNAVAQVVVFPLYSRLFGDIGYGDLQYLMAYVNVITVSVGCAANYARMTAPAATRRENNGDYNIFLLLVALLGLPFTLLVRRFGGVAMSDATYVCYYLLFVAMAFRYYADAAYKLTLNYRHYFYYYLCISVGYGVGAFLVYRTGIWPLGLLVGEAFGVIFAYVRGNTLRVHGLKLSPAWRHTFRIILTLLVSEGIAQLIFNIDRLLLKILVGSAAVTVYYLATLVGKTISLLTAPLNGVIIGYLARYEGGLSRRLWRLLCLGSLAAILLFTGVCAVGGYIVLLLLYPTELDAVKEFLLVGSLGQVIYFITGIMTVVLIRFAKKSYQVYINLAFGVAFFGLGIPATISRGIWGFAIAMVIACAVRWLVAVLLGAWHARGAERQQA